MVRISVDEVDEAIVRESLVKKKAFSSGPSSLKLPLQRMGD